MCSADSALEVVDLCKAYGGEIAVQDASLNVKAGDVVVLLGVNGAGKSTLVRALLGIESPTSGVALIKGRSSAAVVKESMSGIGYASQDNANIELLTVRQNLMLWAGLRGLRGRSRRSCVKSLLCQFGLADLADRRADMLSGGERRRLHVAAAFVDCHTLLVLDEPTSSVDIFSSDAILRQISRAAQSGAGVLLTSHDSGDILRLEADVVPIVKGRTGRRIPHAELGRGIDGIDSAVRRVLSGSD